MRKMLLMLVAAVSLTVATVAAPSNAQAYCRGCWIGAGVAGAVIAGAAIANSAPYYGYGYGYPTGLSVLWAALLRLRACLLRAALLRLLRAAPLLLVRRFRFPTQGALLAARPELLCISCCVNVSTSPTIPRRNSRMQTTKMMPTTTGTGTFAVAR